MEPTTDTAPNLPTQDLQPAAPPTTPGRGRRRILNKTKCQEVCTLITAGCGIEDAARHVGCVPKTIFREARRNPDFGKSLQEAQTAAELTPLYAMRTAASQNWRAAAGPLDRTSRQRFARLNSETAPPGDSQAFNRDIPEAIGPDASEEEVREYLFCRLCDFTEEIRHLAWMKTQFQKIKPISHS